MFTITCVNFPVNISLSVPHFNHSHFISLLLLISDTFLPRDTFPSQGVMPGSLRDRLQCERYQLRIWIFFCDCSAKFPGSCSVWM